MNCWKTINFTKQYGSQRLLFLSSITMLITFILLYVPIAYFFVPTSFYDNHFIILLCGLGLIYPLHKFLHYLPLAHTGSKVMKQIDWKFGFYPIINIRVKEPIGKYLFLLALFLPFFVITASLIIACFSLPNYGHYFTILIAFHIGLSVPDIICGKSILSAPKQAYIEENDEGFEILVCKS